MPAAPRQIHVGGAGLTTDQRTPWERRFGETRKAYAGFVAYRDMGIDRSLAKVSRELGKSTALLSRWSARDDWVSRAHAWDDEQHRIKDAAQLQAAVEMGERHARSAEVLLGKALQGLQTIEAKDIGPRDAAYMMDVSVKIERLSRGQPNERVELVGLLVTPLVQQLIAVFVECNDIEERDARATQFAERADQVVEAIVGRFLPSGIGGTAT